MEKIEIEKLDLSFMCECNRKEYVNNCKRINEAIETGYNTEQIVSLRFYNSLIVHCYSDTFI